MERERKRKRAEVLCCFAKWIFCICMYCKLQGGGGLISLLIPFSLQPFLCYFSFLQGTHRPICLVVSENREKERKKEKRKKLLHCYSFSLHSQSVMCCVSREEIWLFGNSFYPAFCCKDLHVSVATHMKVCLLFNSYILEKKEVQVAASRMRMRRSKKKKKKKRRNKKMKEGKTGQLASQWNSLSG